MWRIVVLFAPLALILGCEARQMKYWERVSLGPVPEETHILSIKCKSDGVLVGTFGLGALFSEDGGKTWRLFATSENGDSTGLSLNYILGGDWDGSYIILATLGDGLNISTDDGATWKRLGYNFFGVEYLYCVGVTIQDGTKYVPTADGIVYFSHEIDPAQSYSERPYKTIDKTQGLASQYIYDMIKKGKNVYVGSLHDFSFSSNNGGAWRNFAPSGKRASNGVSPDKVRAVAVSGNEWYAGCDGGLFVSGDEGETWKDISEGLPSPFVHDLLIDRSGNLWVATYKGVAKSGDGGASYQLFGKESGFYGESINSLAEGGRGNIYAGTNYGLYRLADKLPARNVYPEPQAEFTKTEEPAHQWMLRPVSPDDNNQRDQTYLYGAKMGGYFRQHQGCEYNNPEGTPLLAVDDGTIVYRNDEIGHTVLKCDRRFGDLYVYAHYHHMSVITRNVGDRIDRGDVIGAVGKRGNVTNEHLHFEVSLSDKDDPNVPNRTVNNELWQEPLPGCGTIVGAVTDKEGKLIIGAKIYGVEKPVPTETPFSYAETYRDSVNSSPAYGENFVIADVPAGAYLLWVEDGDSKYAVKALVEPSMVTRVKLVISPK